MWTRQGWLAIALVVLTGAAWLGCAGPQEPAVETGGPADIEEPMAATEPEPEPPATVVDLFPEGEGRDLVLNNCAGCHSPACTVIGQRTQARWDGLLESHREHAAGVVAEDLDTIFEYLSSHFNEDLPEPLVPPQFLEGGCTPF